MTFLEFCEAYGDEHVIAAHHDRHGGREYVRLQMATAGVPTYTFEIERDTIDQATAAAVEIVQFLQKRLPLDSEKADV